MEQLKAVESMIKTWAAGWYPTADDMGWTQGVIDNLDDDRIWTSKWFSIKFDEKEKECTILGIEKDHTDNLHTLARVLKILDYLEYTIHPPEPKEN
jgi:uncharacterized protein YihD (DUF1040 family)